MPARRLLTRGALALIVPAALVPVVGPASADGTDAPTDPPGVPTDVSSVTRPHQRISLQALPRIVQPGGRVAAADDARAAVVATLRPVTPGRRVQVQVRRGETWEVLATRRQDLRGRAQFAVPAAEAGHPLTYRVRAMASGSLRPLSSRPVSTARWQHPAWTDEFGGDRLGPEWSHRGRDYVPTSRRTCAKGDPSAVSVGGGAVRLSVVVDPDATGRCRIRGRDQAPGRHAYRLNGHIGTEGAFGFRYGVAAARVKFHRLRGQHGAFWLQPVAGMYPGAAGSEIDVVEYFGDRHPQGGLATFMHRYEGKRRVSAGGWIPDSRSYLQGRWDGWSKNYHVFSVEWRPRLVVFRIDGKETGRMRGRGVSDVRQFPILSLLAADYEVPRIADARLPQHMYVDWVRVWETNG
ncbi:beta-glucanase (GH16 family) [Nocardioides cavernae]|uniref:Beta-glucanase (GH16 family) n=1 Tax=Nocardioides cavernae TaxID=1921566 RepID=A0A7Y9H6Y4_9ACTN|nr:glycoside hydrolase family 16 protein [Nocardioides cavernae]NYE38821.1 beta-glucanase (GH16 family) [Nocardioides cavernae]